MKVAALDLGSNTFLCLIAEVENGLIKKIIEDQVQIVRLGQGMNKSDSGAKKTILPDAIMRARSCLQDFAKTISKHKPEKVLAMATSAARDASNGEELFKIGRELNIPIEIIPGAREAAITYKGSISGQKNTNQNFLVIDIGGGSTEIILGKGKDLEFSKSLDIGCVRLTEKYLSAQPANEKQIQALRQEVRQEILNYKGQLGSKSESPVALAVAGTPTELARIEIGEFIAEKIDGFKISQKKLDEWFKSFSVLKPEQITKNFGVSPGRADVILVGVIILQEFCQAFDLPCVEVSTRGVRFGVAIEIEQRARKENP